MRGLKIVLASALSVVIVAATAASEPDTHSRLYRTLTGKKEQAKLRSLSSLMQNPEQCEEVLDDLIAVVTTIAAEAAEKKAAELAESTVMLIQLIGSIDDPRAIETLIELLEAKRMEIAMASADVLGQINCRAALPALKRQAQRPEFAANYGFRFGLYRAIARIKDPDAVEFLTKSLPTLNGQLGFEVDKFLEQITRDHFRGDQAGFDAWKRRRSQRFESTADDNFSEYEYRLPKYERPDYYGIGIHAKRLVFVIDHSSSMGEIVNGESRLVKAKRELIRAIRSLPETTEFTIILFEAKARPWRKSLVEASDRNKKTAIRYVTGIRQGLGTNTFAGLERALGLDYVEAIFLLSDGNPTRGKFVAPEQIIREVGRQNAFRHIIINTVGISTTGVTQRFMRELAAENGGEYQGTE